MLVYQRVNMNKHKQTYIIVSPKHHAKCAKTSLKLKTKKHLITHNWSIIKFVLLSCCRLLFVVSIPNSKSSSDPPTVIETPRWCKTKSHSAVLFQIPPDLVSSGGWIQLAWNLGQCDAQWCFGLLDGCNSVPMNHEFGWFICILSLV